jgi:hypothetical protein
MQECWRLNGAFPVAFVRERDLGYKCLTAVAFIDQGEEGGGSPARKPFLAVIIRDQLCRRICQIPITCLYIDLPLYGIFSTGLQVGC